MRDAFAHTNGNDSPPNADGNGNDPASNADGNGDYSASVANAHSDGATADNTYTTATADAAAAPVDYSGIWKINGNWRSNSPVLRFVWRADL